MSNALIVCDTSIAQHNNLYCLNDLHQAAGGERKHEPNRFIRSQQTQELIAELSNSPDLGITPLKVIKGNFSDGGKQGTYACKPQTDHLTKNTQALTMCPTDKKQSVGIDLSKSTWCHKHQSQVLFLRLPILRMRRTDGRGAPSGARLIPSRAVRSILCRLFAQLTLPNRYSTYLFGGAV